MSVFRKDLMIEIQRDKYDFLIQDKHLGKNIVLLGLGGSRAYGLSTATSDWDWRGCALNTKAQILGNEKFEVFTNEETDTTIYAFNKLIKLLSSANPNTIEMLGLKPEHYLFLTSIGQELIGNRKMFLSKRAVHSFGGYATSQLRRLDNKAARLVGQAEREQHILNSINNASYDFKNKFFTFPDDSIKLYLDVAVNEDFEKEIFMDIHLSHYPLRDYKSMWSEMNNIIKEYGKFGKRNTNAIAHDKLAKHMMHLIRLYLMCFDILEKEEIVTYREADHDLLMEIRAGKYLDEERQPIPEFYEMVNEFEKRLDYAKKNTSLPDSPDNKAIEEFVISVNERVVRGDV